MGITIEIKRFFPSPAKICTFYLSWKFVSGVGIINLQMTFLMMGNYDVESRLFRSGCIILLKAIHFLSVNRCLKLKAVLI